MSLAAKLSETEPQSEASQARKTGSNGAGIFTLANSVPTLRVLDWLGIAHTETARGEMATCPGCGEDGALVCRDGGIKCMHARCAHVGPMNHPGFRSNVDLVAHVRGTAPEFAARELCDHFGLKRSASNDAHDDEPPPDRFDDEEPASKQPTEEPKETPRRGGLSVSDVIGGWTSEGPLVHESTGIAKLDALTGGGPVYGTRWIINGAPDAGKTLLLMHIADAFALRGVHVGILAVDEEAGDLVTRLAQRRGYMRVDCEVRAVSTLADIAETLRALPLKFYDDMFTIETAAADLVAGLPPGTRAALLCDSIQTVKSNAIVAAWASGRELSEAAAVTSNVRALRVAATKNRLIAIATSELGRGAYRESDPAKQTTTMASGKWSSSIEYSARVLIGLRSMPDVPDLVDLELAKNKHGPRDEHVYLRIDRRSQMLSEVAYEPAPAPTEEARTSVRDERTRTQSRTDAGHVAVLLAQHPGLGVRDLRGGMRARLGAAGRERVDAAFSVLADAVVRQPAPGNAIRMYLDGRRVVEEVLSAIAADDRDVVLASRPPGD